MYSCMHYENISTVKCIYCTHTCFERVIYFKHSLSRDIGYLHLTTAELHTHTLSLSLTHTLTHTHTHSLSHTHTHTLQTTPPANVQHMSYTTYVHVSTYEHRNVQGRERYHFNCKQLAYACACKTIIYNVCMYT